MRTYGIVIWVYFLLVNTNPSTAGVLNRLVGNKTHSHETGDIEAALENNDIGPPDHLDAVKFERDGHINAEFRYEIFLGEEKHHFKKESRDKQIAKLKEIFHRADLNKDNSVDEDELHKWIMLMVNDHMKQATMESDEKFFFVDADKSNDVTYDEFHEAFMSSLRKMNISHGGKFTNEYISERLSTIKKEWEKADLNNDKILSRREFLFFQHPEMSNRTLTMAVDEFLQERDFDGNDKLDVKEFVFGFPVDEDINLEDYADGAELMQDKIYQFKVFLDLNKDGFASIEELRVYLNPFSDLNARNDAHDMVFFVDVDKDGKLSLEEVLDASEYLTGTKLYDASSYFHSQL